MLVQKVKRTYETRPLDCWAKAKELRRNFYRNEVDARERGLFLVDAFNSYNTIAGIPNCHTILLQPYGASIAAEGNKFARECRAVSEGMGYGRDQCGYMLNWTGALNSNRGLLGKEFHQRDFAVAESNYCDCNSKHSQVLAEFQGIPHNWTDMVGYYGEPDAERDEARIEYLVTQQLELIEWLEKITGQEFDHENFIETAKGQMRLAAFRADTLACLQHIPSPIDQKSLYSLLPLGSLVRSHQQETEAFWKSVRDEMRWRVENNIAAVATERFRWVELEPPPWFFLRYYRYMEEYGAVCLGTMYQQVRWEEQPDGTWTRPPTPLERGDPFGSSEDVIRARIRERNGGTGSQPVGHGARHEQYIDRFLRNYWAYKCNGAFLTLHRSGLGCVFGMREVALRLQEEGIPYAHYETSHPGDRCDLDESRMLEQLDTFMETQGLRKLEVED
ncbi:2-hydroxyacyl-CoA dehydratase [Chloroflexota bacterium]